MIHDYLIEAWPYVVAVIAMVMVIAMFVRGARRRKVDDEEAQKKGDKQDTTTYFVLAIVMFAIALGGHTSSTAFICLGCAFVSLGATTLNKKK